MRAVIDVSKAAKTLDSIHHRVAGGTSQTHQFSPFLSQYKAVVGTNLGTQCISFIKNSVLKWDSAACARIYTNQRLALDGPQAFPEIVNNSYLNDGITRNSGTGTRSFCALDEVNGRGKTTYFHNVHHHVCWLVSSAEEPH